MALLRKPQLFFLHEGSGALSSILLEKIDLSSKSAKQRQVGLAGAASAVDGCSISLRLVCAGVGAERGNGAGERSGKHEL